MTIFNYQSKFIETPLNVRSGLDGIVLMWPGFVAH